MWSRAARRAALLALTAGLLPALASAGGERDDTRAVIARQAQELLAARDFEGAARLLADRLRRGGDDGAL